MFSLNSFIYFFEGKIHEGSQQFTRSYCAHLNGGKSFDNHALLEMANKLTAHQLNAVIQTSGIASVNGMRYLFS